MKTSIVVLLALCASLAPSTLAVRPVVSKVMTEDDASALAIEVDKDLHRKLTSDPNACFNEFVCPPNSERIYGQKCYDSFNDCQCLLGYYKNAENTECIAKEGLCTLDYVDKVAGELVELESWVDMANDENKSPEERYAAIESINLYLPEVWNEYNDGKASCEMFVFGDEANRRLFISAIGNVLEAIGKGIKRVAKKVVKTITNSVEILVNGVVQVVECGVGIATDTRCGLIGCAFGLGGVAGDIAFTIATGGFNKFAATCDVMGDNEIMVLLGGISSVVCAVNELVDSPVLAEVCSIGESVEENGVLEQLPPAVEAFVDAIIGAICGNPGSAIMDLLEEIVACEVDCAEDDNAFCPVAATPTPAPTPFSPPPGPEATKYFHHSGKACRTAGGGLGEKGVDFVIDNGGFEQCEATCSSLDMCLAFEVFEDKNRCEIWLRVPPQFETKAGADCYVKV